MYYCTRNLYVAHQEGNISVISMTNDKVVERITTPVNLLLFGMAVDNTMERLYITTGTILHNQGGLLVYDMKTNQLIKQLDNIASSPNDITLSVDGKQAYVLNDLLSNILVMNTEDFTIMDTIQLDCSAIGKARISRDGSSIYVTCSDGYLVIHSN